MPKKPLVTEAHVLEAVRAGRTELVVPPNALVTALARDTARARGVAFVAPPDASAPAAPAAPPTDAPKVVAVGSDHGAFALKESLKPFLASLGWGVLDLGTHSTDAVDYPDFAYAVARAVALGQARFGIAMDGAGMGSCMVANKVPGIRAAACWNEFTAWNARAHNDAQVLCLGSRALGDVAAQFVVRRFLETAFEGGRHAARVAKVMDVEARRPA